MIPQTQKSCSKMKLKGSSIFVCYYQIYIVQTNTYAFVFHFAFIYLFAFFIVLFTCKLDISIQKYRTESAKFCATILTLREKCPYSELFWHVFSHIRTEYGEIRSVSPYSVRMRENKEQDNCKYGHFLRSVTYPCHHFQN